MRAISVTSHGPAEKIPFEPERVMPSAGKRRRSPRSTVCASNFRPSLHVSPPPHIARSTMNATDKFVAAHAHVDEAAIQPLPNSRKIYVEGSRPDIRVPMREISQDDTPTAFGGEKNPPIFVYDCSGPYSDPAAKIDIRSGLPALRGSPSAATSSSSLTCRPSLAASAPPTRVSTNCASPACTASRCAPRPAPTFRRCITRARASSRPRWNTSPSARTTTVVPTSRT